MGGKKQPATTTSISKVELPPWVDAAGQANYAEAVNVAGQPQYSNYDPNQRYLGPGATTQGADAMARQNLNSADPIFADAMKGIQGLMGYNAEDISGTGYQAQTIKDKLDSGELATYLNPYLNQVEGSALTALDKSRTSALQGNASKAAAAKSFGGSRSGVVDAITNAESARAAGDISNQIRAAGFGAATGLMGQDVGQTNQARQFGAQTEFGARQANQAADINSANIRQRATDQMSQAGRDKQASEAQKYMTMLGMGMREDDLTQRRADFKYDQYLQKLREPLNDLNIRLSALGMTPYGKTETGTKTSQSESSGTDWATFGLGALKSLPGIFGMFSDRDAKTDIEKLGKDPASGLTLYAYRYKADPKSYPKVVGPMAQDIEEEDPSMVRQVGGKRIIAPSMAW